MTRSLRAAVVTAFVLGGFFGAFLYVQWIVDDSGGTSTAARPVFVEVAWPFPTDEWGKGKAFRCNSRDCGTDVVVYLRPKIGFCNCTTGVADDEELERLSDFRLVVSGVTPVAEGRPITVAWMKGRSRSYAAAGGWRLRSLLSVAFNDRCDAIVATVVIARHPPDAMEPHVIEFLNSSPVLHWLEEAIGL